MAYIFLHGLGQNPSSWNKTTSYMADVAEPDNIICPDLFLSLKGREPIYDNLYRSFSEYCSNIPEPLHLCGLSLGAVIALNYTIDNPGKVKSLVLIAAQYKMPKALLKLQNIIFRFMPEAAFKNMGFHKGDFIKLTNSMTNLNFSENLKNISCPVLAVCGNKDSANTKAAEGLCKNIKNAQFRLIQDSGHEVNIDAPEKLAEILNNFYGA